MKYYNHKGEEVSKAKYDFLKEMDFVIHGNVFEENNEDSIKLLSPEKYFINEDGRIDLK